MNLRIALSSSLLFSSTIFFRNLCKNRQKINAVDEKFILIIGCDSKIGLTAVQKISQAGFKIIGTCLTDEDKFNLQKQFSHQDIHILKIDVTDKNSIEDAEKNVRDIIKGNYGLWAIINNVGVMNKIGPFDWLEKRDFKESLNVNFFSHLEVLKTFLPLLKKSKGRIITNTSSEVTFPLPHLSCYCASKMALDGFLCSISHELAMFGIKSIDIQHGYVQTNMTANMHKKWEQAWKNIDISLQNEYGLNYFQKKYENLRKLSNVQLPSTFLSKEDVAECYLRAVHSRNPKTTYYVGNYAKLVKILSYFSPNNEVRRFFVRFLSDIKHSKN